jgi:hypothetical protein
MAISPEGRYTRNGNKAYMSRTITSILLFVALVSVNGATAVMSCAPSLNHKDRFVAPVHCKKGPAKTATSMSCCRHVPRTHSEEIAKRSPDCCQMSAPLPDESRSTPPANSSEAFRLQAHSQLLDSSAPLPSSTLAFVPSSSTIAFCLDRSETYLLASTFRI